MRALLCYLCVVCRFMKEKYAPSLLSVKGKVVVLLGSAALLIAGIYGVTQVLCVLSMDRSKGLSSGETPVCEITQVLLSETENHRPLL